MQLTEFDGLLPPVGSKNNPPIPVHQAAVALAAPLRRGMVAGPYDLYPYVVSEDSGGRVSTWRRADLAYDSQPTPPEPGQRFTVTRTPGRTYGVAVTAGVLGPPPGEGTVGDHDYGGGYAPLDYGDGYAPLAVLRSHHPSMHNTNYVLRVIIPSATTSPRAVLQLSLYANSHPFNQPIAVVEATASQVIVTDMRIWNAGGTAVCGDAGMDVRLENWARTWWGGFPDGFVVENPDGTRRMRAENGQWVEIPGVEFL